MRPQQETETKGIETHPALRAGGETYGGLETVLLLSDDREFESLVREYAKSMGCKVYLSKWPDTDLLAVPHFIALVDRRTIGEDDWLKVLEVRRDEFLWRDRIVILDGQPWPVDRRCQRIRPGEFTRIVSATGRALMTGCFRLRIRSLVPDRIHRYALSYDTMRVYRFRLAVARLFRRQLPRRETRELHNENRDEVAVLKL